MITCVASYVIDPSQMGAFETLAQRCLHLVTQNGGTHHGYFLPAAGASDRALAFFSFGSLAAYERYRTRFEVDPGFKGG